MAASVSEGVNSKQARKYIIAESPVLVGIENNQGFGVGLKNGVGAKAQMTCR